MPLKIKESPLTGAAEAASSQLAAVTQSVLPADPCHVSVAARVWGLNPQRAKSARIDAMPRATASGARRRVRAGNFARMLVSFDLRGDCDASADEAWDGERRDAEAPRGTALSHRLRYWFMGRGLNSAEGLKRLNDGFFRMAFTYLRSSPRVAKNPLNTRHR